jgi:hypothetical protein
MTYIVEIANSFHQFNNKREAYLWAQEISSRGWGQFQVYPKEPVEICCLCHEKEGKNPFVLEEVDETSGDMEGKICNDCLNQYFFGDF